MTDPGLGLHGIHHLGLTVRDAEASARWYETVLGFVRTGEFRDPAGERHKVFLTHPGLRQRLGLCEHLRAPRTLFDERQTGLDHLAFEVASREDLDSWAARLQAHGVAFSPIATANTMPGTAVLVFRDPDNIQLELIAPG
jgi:glyoxylase I family protein